MTQAPQHETRRIVAGVDGSPSATAGLRWAVRQAALTGAVVDALIAWEYPPGYGGYGFAPVPPDPTDYRGLAAKTLADAVTSSTDPDNKVEIRQLVVEGHPASALLSAAASADLLVVGSRGRGGFAGLLLGSVSQHCAQHARCPVLIIRDPEPESPEPGSTES
jgi:nucleotide-binding universal stress UspA family protein